MKKDDILDAMSGIKEEYINEAVPGAARRKSSVWAKTGVIAACLCLFAAVGFLIPYGMNKPAVKPPIDTDIVGSGVETTAPATNETTGMVEDSTDTGDVQNTPGIGGTALCKVHEEIYHMVPDFLTELRDANEMFEWANSLKIDESKVKSTTECPYEYNIKLLIDKFGITKEEFIEAYPFTSAGAVDVDLLYSGTAEEIDGYYRNFGYFSIESKRVGHYDYLFGEIFTAYYDEIYEQSKNKDMLEYIPIPELVVMLDIDRDELLSYIDMATQKSMEANGECYTFDYDLDMLYGADGEIILEIDADMSDKDIDEMFCRVGRYADNDFDFIENPDDTDVEDNTPAIGGSDYPCKIHHTNYHMLPSELIAFVGGMEVIEAKFNKDTVGEMSCPMLSIKQVIDGFDISVDEFAEAVRLVYYPYYDLDVLFNGTLEDADELFSNQDWIIFTCSSLSTCYRNLYDEIENRYPDETKEITEGMRHLSIPELVKLLDIKREDLEEMIKKSSDDGTKVTYNYNLDMLYDSDGEIIFEKPDDVSTYELDEMFCRVGRHAE